MKETAESSLSLFCSLLSGDLQLIILETKKACKCTLQASVSAFS